MITMLGLLIGITPDVTKFFGDIFFHSIFAIPIIGFIYTVLTRMILKTSFLKSFLKISLVVFLSHHMIDLLGNGISLFFPIHTVEQELDVIPQSLEILIIILFVIGLILYYLKMSFRISVLPLLAVSIILFIQIVSSSVIQTKLKSEYDPETITMTPHNTILNWSIDVRLEDGTIIKGEAQLFHYNIEYITDGVNE